MEFGHGIGHTLVRDMVPDHIFEKDAAFNLKDGYLRNLINAVGAWVLVHGIRSHTVLCCSNSRRLMVSPL
jgi:hypothetical protein